MSWVWKMKNKRNFSSNENHNHAYHIKTTPLIRERRKEKTLLVWRRLLSEEDEEPSVETKAKEKLWDSETQEWEWESV